MRPNKGGHGCLGCGWSYGKNFKYIVQDIYGAEGLSQLKAILAVYKKGVGTYSLGWLGRARVVVTVCANYSRYRSPNLKPFPNSVSLEYIRLCLQPKTCRNGAKVGGGTQGAVSWPAPARAKRDAISRAISETCQLLKANHKPFRTSV